MYCPGFDLMTPGSTGRRSNHFAMEDSRFGKSIFPIYRQPISIIKDYFGLKCILSYYVPVQTIVSPYDANCVTPLIYPTTDLDFLFGIIVSFDLSFYFLFF